MEIVSQSIEGYIASHTSEEPGILKKINRYTHANVLMPRMLSGHSQGRLLSMISKIARPQSILEIGTFTGYSAICLAEGLKEGGRLVTIDKNEELEDVTSGFFEEGGLKSRINYIIGDALEIIPNLEGPFDLVFIDADKENYKNYFDLVIDKVSSGGLILADNVLWSGKVVENAKDKDTRAILEFNKHVNNDKRVENIILPIRDGLFLIRKL